MTPWSHRPQDVAAFVTTADRTGSASGFGECPVASACVLSDEWNGPWVQLDGTASVLDLPDALEPLVEYFRCISGEHPDWDEYRAAMESEGRVIVRIALTRAGPDRSG